ncbi:helix-turn-helix transcriptional regulator [Pseudokineococcus sp. 5B2Z-1]|uniref:helix-turn-helix transcriptional regulator n=1 Tax=Pseudokineococcus sp. 5B2Z-1 TaxID=3132744 RepID=UPI0030A11C9C
MDNRAEVREFLTTRRAKISPARAGLPAVGARRVPGLRRAEVAVLAGVSAEYYAKIERGALAGVSPSVLESLARALQLDDAEREHLVALARAADGPRVRPTRSRGAAPVRGWRPPVHLQRVLDAVTGGPAIVRNGRMDLLATNLLGRAMHAPLHDSGVACTGGPPSFPRYTFLDEASRAFYPDWEAAARTCVAILRTEAGRDPHDKALHDLVGELSTRSADFAALWSAHDVRLHGTGTKTFHHPAVGDLELTYEGMELLSAPGLTFTVYTAEPASPTAQALSLLAAWAATELTGDDVKAAT